jgi:hypothetical protein
LCRSWRVRIRHAHGVPPFRDREELASNPDATYHSIVAREYSDEARALDTEWAEAMRATQSAFVRTPRVRRAGYPIEVYSGYAVGGGAGLDVDGLGYKVLFELADVHASLAPAMYLEFTLSLAHNQPNIAIRCTSSPNGRVSVALLSHVATGLGRMGRVGGCLAGREPRRLGVRACQRVGSQSTKWLA